MIYTITVGVGALGSRPSIEGARMGSRQQRPHSEAEGAVHVLTDRSGGQSETGSHSRGI